MPDASSLKETLQLGTCISQGFGKVSSEGAGIASYTVEIRFKESENLASGTRITLSLPDALKVTGARPKEVAREGNSKSLVYALSDVCEYSGTDFESDEIVARISGWFQKPLVGWETFKIFASTDPDEAEGGEVTFESTAEIEALEDLENVWGSLSWPQMRNLSIRQNLINHSDGTVSEPDHVLAFPAASFPRTKNPIRKGNKYTSNVKVLYSSSDSPALGRMRPTCSNVGISVQANCASRVSAEAAPIGIHLDGGNLPEVTLTESIVLQTVVRYFPELNPAF